MTYKSLRRYYERKWREPEIGNRQSELLGGPHEVGGRRRVHANSLSGGGTAQLQAVGVQHLTRDAPQAAIVELLASILFIARDRAAGNTEKILAYIVKAANAPLISLSNFDIRMDAAESLPLYFLTRVGAIPFDFIGDELMVAVLNPFNQDLKDAVEQASKRKCHFYLVPAPEYDHSLEEIKTKLKDQE